MGAGKSCLVSVKYLRNTDQDIKKVGAKTPTGNFMRKTLTYTHS